MDEERIEKVKKEIFEKIKEFYELKHKNKSFTPGKDLINYAGRVFDEKEMIAAVDSILEFWLTLKDYDKKFTDEFSKYLEIKHSLLVNSGSSANLVAVSTLCSSQLKNCLRPGDEVITPAMTFSTTAAPIIQNGLVPVFVDVKLENYNIDAEQLEAALSERTRAIMIPHVLGIPCEMDAIMDFAEQHNLFVIEDACDALDSKYAGKPCGTFGTFGTYSFYAAHHIAMGEGGALVTNNEELYKITKSLRDWGRLSDYEDRFLNFEERFKHKIEEVEYDIRYLFVTLGYNLKPLDLQAAIGLEQLKKLPQFTEARKRNFEILHKALSKYDELIMPQAPAKADPSWFALPITVNTNKFTRFELVKFLEENKIQTRYAFAGNILKQPAFKEVKFRQIRSLENSNRILRDSFFIGLYPGIDKERLDYVIEKFAEFIAKH